MIRVAQIMGKMEKGGVEAVVMNYYRHIDRDKIQFDFIVDDDSSCPQENEILSLGGRVIRISPYQHIIDNMRDLRKLFKENQYAIVHAELTTMSVFSLAVAKECGVPVRICHGHNTACKGETKKNLMKYLLRPFSKTFATHCFACSEYAGKWLFGRNFGKSDRYRVIPNAIDTDQFRFREDVRRDIRKELGVEDKFVVGHIGRFAYQKNHDFLIDIFSEVYQKNSSAVLLLVGEGALQDNVKQKVHALGLDAAVRFLGVREDVDRLYQAFDVFCLPSRYEGLGLVLIEAQTAGLHCVFSDIVPEDADIVPEYVLRLSLNQSAISWAEKIMELEYKDRDLFHFSEKYDLSIQSKNLEKFYVLAEKSIYQKREITAMKKAIIMSAKYAPGHFSHMLAYDKLFRSIGYDSAMLLAEGYKDFQKDYPEYSYLSLGQIGLIRADVLLIYNMSAKDSKYIKTLKKNNPDIKVFFVYHEPWFGYKKWLDDLRSKRESFKDSIKTLGRYFFVRPILKKTDTVLLPSQKAEEYYTKICVRINSHYTLFPLVFTDEAGSVDLSVKKYFSFVSTVQNSKNFSMFLDYVKYKSKKDPEALFQIATRTDITDDLDRELRDLIDRNRLIVVHGHSLSNREINQAYAICNCTWMLYNRSTQSGVICKSFMFGAPVIASEIGSFQEIVAPENGIILYGSYTLDDIDNAYERIRGNLAALSDGARDTFISRFYYGNHVDRFREIIEN